MYKCPDCSRLFDEPEYMEVCWEDFYGVGGMFMNRTYGVIKQCPYCHEAFNEEDFYYDEEEEDE